LDDILYPFLKWAGGKRWLAQHSGFALPKFNGAYIEPFLGSGSIFFHARPKRAILSDVNPQLIETYNVIKADHSCLVRRLRVHARNHSTQYYYFMRDEHRPRTEAGRAARFLYLNRTCWNGLYRVNKSGRFNVPKGTKSQVILETDAFQQVSLLLRDADILCSDFAPIIDAASAGDLLYVDPPYTVKHNMNGFVKYNEILFSWQDQVRLRDCVVKAHKRGVNVIISNADHHSIRELYESAHSIQTIARKSVIAGNNRGRGTITELFICL
jgi:DNA adenine methylase